MWMALLMLLIIYCFWLYYVKSKRYQNHLKNIPIVSKVPVIGTLIALLAMKPDNLHLKFEEYVGKFGKTFYGSIFGIVVVVTADVRHVETVLSSQQHTRKHLLYRLLSSWLGNGLLLSHGSEWKTMRKIITPIFHFKILEQFVEVFDRHSALLVKMLEPLADGKTVIDIYPYISLVTLDIIAGFTNRCFNKSRHKLTFNPLETAMGVSINALSEKSDFVQAINDVTKILATRFVRPAIIYPTLFRWMMPSLYRKQQNGIATMHKFTENIIEERRKVLRSSDSTSTDTEDVNVGIKKRLALLDVLLQANESGQPLPESQIRDEVNTFMFEGHDTTTSAISFCLYLLSRHPQVQQNLFEEIRSHFGDDLEQVIRCCDLQKLVYLNSVVKESLRIYPPIPAIGRFLEEDCLSAGSILPAKANVIILVWQILHDPENFPEPMSFKPERHLELNLRRNVFSYIPFSAGPRNCIGQRFAVFEMKTVLIKILRQYELLPLGDDVQPSIKIVLRSKVGVNFGIRPRS